MKKNNQAYFITIEGIEGAGKSTAMHYLQEYLTSQQIPLVVTREPGGTPIAEDIRNLLLSHHQESMADDTELLLMFAGRAQHLASVIKPALANGQWVLTDRFTDATYAYQGGGRGINNERIHQLEQWVQQDLRPDLVLLLDLPVEVGLQRIVTRGKMDRIESQQIEFHQRVRQAYLDRADDPRHNYVVIDASQTESMVEQQLQTALQRILS